jgi:GNAT superfamily N-acetyltransferase
VESARVSHAGSWEVRPLRASDRERWNELRKGYQSFYKTELAAEIFDLTWTRLNDPAEPMFVLGSFVDGHLVGIVHYLYHCSCWTSGPYCYLQDLFTDPEFRGNGVARGLIERVYEVALAAGASRVYWLTQETNEVAIRLYDKVADRPGFIQYRKILM